MKPGIYDMPAVDYHADTRGVSKSMLWAFHDSRRKYESLYVLKNAPEKEATLAMDKGTLADAGLLEPDRLHELYAIYPNECLAKNGSTNTNAANAFYDEHSAAGKIVMKEDAFNDVLAMVEAVRKKFGDWLARPSLRQKAVYWVDETTGLLCRCRPDWIIDTPQTTFVFDLKTTENVSPRKFARVCEAKGYWMQESHYSAGVEAVMGKPVEFMFVVVESQWPWRCAIQSIVNAHEGRLETRQSLCDLAECRRSGNYAEPWEDDVAQIQMRWF